MQRHAHLVLTVPWPNDDKEQKLQRCVIGVERMRQFVERRGYSSVSCDLSIGQSVKDEFVAAIHRVVPAKGDMLLVMFSGHGSYNETSKVSGVNFSDPNDVLSHADLLRQVLRHKKLDRFHEVLVIVDACWSSRLNDADQGAFGKGLERAFTDEADQAEKIVLAWSADGEFDIGTWWGNEFVEGLCVAAGATTSYDDLAQVLPRIRPGYGMRVGTALMGKFPFSPFADTKTMVARLGALPKLHEAPAGG